MSEPAPANPLVSVVIPIYNGAEHIAQTLRCVAGQTYAAIEIIVVDDQSTDGSVDAVLATGIPLRLIRQANARVSAARNNGLSAASGEFVCFLDQDDHWFDSHVEHQVRCFQALPHTGVVFSALHHWYPTASGYPDPAALLPPQPQAETDPDYTGWIYHQFLLDCWALTSATMVRRETLLKFGAFDPARLYSEDWELWLRLSREVPFAKLNWPPVLYRQHPVQGSRVARRTDYRTELLLANARAHGLASRDGRQVPQALFDRTIARYQMAFGYHHLQCGDRALGVRSLLQAWRRSPGSWRYLALAAAATLGWRPRGEDLQTQVGAS